MGPSQPYSSSAGPLPEGELDATDGRAMGQILIAAVFGLIGVVVTFVAPYAIGYSFFAFSTRSSAFANVTVVYELMALAAVGAVFTVIQLWFFRSAFRPLAIRDSGLRTPATLSLLAIIGVVLVLGGALWLLNVV